jgi:hypothetical protein
VIGLKERENVPRHFSDTTVIQFGSHERRKDLQYAQACRRLPGIVMCPETVNNTFGSVRER